MFNMPLDTLVRCVARTELEQHTHTAEQALYLNFDVRMSCFQDDMNKTFSSGIHLLYHSIPGSTTITVFSGLTDSPLGAISEVKEWKHEITHDSCWIDINVFKELYFDMARKLNDCRILKNLPELAPMQFSTHVGFPLRSVDRVFDWISVEVKKDPDDPRRYRRCVSVLR